MILLSSLSESYAYIITTMLYGKETLILKEVTSTLLSNEIKKKPNQEEQKGSDLVVIRRKGGGERKKSPGSLKARQDRVWWLKKKRKAAEAGIALSGLEETEVLMIFYEDNTSQDKNWIFNSGSTVYVCSKKELSNSLVVKEEEIVKIVDGSACEVIATRTVKVKERDGTVRALEAVWYVPKARYNLISIRVLDEEGCRIQVQ